jgi:hypothetical protein
MASVAHRGTFFAMSGQRLGWLVAMAVVLFGLTQAPTSIATGIVVAMGALMIAYLALHYRRATLDRVQRSAGLLVITVFVLFAAGVLIPGNAGYAVFLGGVVLLFLGVIVLRRYRQPNV